MSTAPLVITIPGTPDRKLSPNARVHWAPKAKAFKQLKHDAYYATFERTRNPEDDPPLFADSIFVLDYVVAWESEARISDDSNAKAMMKAVEDGVALALGINDKFFTLGTLRQEVDPDGVGSVTVTIRPSEEA